MKEKIEQPGSLEFTFNKSIKSMLDEALEASKSSPSERTPYVIHLLVSPLEKATGTFYKFHSATQRMELELNWVYGFLRDHELLFSEVPIVLKRSIESESLQYDANLLSKQLGEHFRKEVVFVTLDTNFHHTLEDNRIKSIRLYEQGQMNKDDLTALELLSKKQYINTHLSIDIDDTALLRAQSFANEKTVVNPYLIEVDTLMGKVNQRTFLTARSNPKNYMIQIFEQFRIAKAQLKQLKQQALELNHQYQRHLEYVQQVLNGSRSPSFLGYAKEAFENEHEKMAFIKEHLLNADKIITAKIQALEKKVMEFEQKIAKLPSFIKQLAQQYEKHQLSFVSAHSVAKHYRDNFAIDIEVDPMSYVDTITTRIPKVSILLKRASQMEGGLLVHLDDNLGELSLMQDAIERFSSQYNVVFLPIRIQQIGDYDKQHVVFLAQCIQRSAQANPIHHLSIFSPPQPSMPTRYTSETDDFQQQRQYEPPDYLLYEDEPEVEESYCPNPIDIFRRCFGY